MVAEKTVRNAGKRNKNENNMTERYLELDPIKVAWTGLSHFSSKYDLKGTYNQKLEALRVLCINMKDYEEKKRIDDILVILYKINKCELCNKPIMWDNMKEKAVSNHEKLTARHLKCHETLGNKK